VKISKTSYGHEEDYDYDYDYDLDKPRWLTYAREAMALPLPNSSCLSCPSLLLFIIHHSSFIISHNRIFTFIVFHAKITALFRKGPS
jgi:hypothetical protein